MNKIKAFSLIEVTLALGIIGLSILPLVKLMSVGFETMHSANNDVRAAFIARQLIAEAQRKPFSELSDMENTALYMDLDGNILQQQNADAVFTVRVRVNPSGEGRNLLGSPNVADVRITVEGTALGNGASRVFSAIVANTEN